MNSSKETVAVVLAAGQSSRMGDFKQLLPINNVPAIVRITRIIKKQVSNCIVIVGHRANEVKSVLRSENVRCVYNTNYKTGMLSSVQCALENICPPRPIILALADQPNILEETIYKMLKVSESINNGIIIPTHNGKRGHPIYIHNLYFREIIALPKETGLNTFIREKQGEIFEIGINSDEILHDMDTLSDYKGMLDRLENK